MFCVKENYKENIQECLKKLWVNMDFFFLLILANKFFPEIAVETVICNGKKASKNHKFRSHQLDKRCITWKKLTWGDILFAECRQRYKCMQWSRAVKPSLTDFLIGWNLQRFLYYFPLIRRLSRNLNILIELILWEVLKTPPFYCMLESV